MKKTSVKSATPATHRRWLRRLTIVLIIVIVVVLALRLALSAALPWLLDRTLSQFGLQGQYEKLHLSLLTGEMELWHLELTADDPNDTLVDLEYCRADISTRSLLTKRLIVPRLEVDGLDVAMTRQADGQWHGWSGLMDRLMQTSSQPAVSAAPQPQRLDLEPPLQLDAIRLQHAQVHVVDLTQTPPVDMLLEMHVRLSDLGSTKRPLKYTLGLSARPALEVCVIEGQGSTSHDHLQTRFEAMLGGLHSQPLAPYLRALGLSSTSNRLDGRVQGNLWLSQPKPENGADTGAPKGLQCGIRISDLSLAADQQADLQLHDFNVALRLPDARHVILEQARVSGGRLNLRRGLDGVTRCLGIAPVSHPSPTSAPAPASNPAGSALSWVVGALDFNDLDLTWVDQTHVPHVPVEVTLQQLRLASLHDTAAPFQAVWSAPGIAERVEARGQIQLNAPEKTLQLALSAHGITLAKLRPYLNRMGWEPTVHDGQLTASLSAQLTPQPNNGQSLDLALTDVSLTDGQELYALQRLALTNLHLNPTQQEMALEKLEHTGERMVVTLDPEGLDLLGLRYRPDLKTQDPNQWRHVESAGRKGPDENPSQATKTTASPWTRIEIGAITADDQQIIFRDQSQVQQEPTRLVGDMSFALDSLVIDFNDDTPWIQPGRCHGTLSIPGLADSVTLAGTLGMEQRKLSFDLEVGGNGLHGPALAHYTSLFGVVPVFDQGDFTGHLQGRLWPTSESLTLDLDVHDVLWADANQTLFGLSRARLEALQLGPNGIQAGTIDVNEPMVRLTRDPNGCLAVAGIGLLPTPSSAPPSTPRQAATRTLHIDKLGVHQGRVYWRDEDVQPAVVTEGNFDVTCESLALEPNAVSSPFQLTARIPGILENLQLNGTTQLTPSHQTVALKVEADALNTEPLRSYFSPSCRPVYQQGHIQVALQADLARQPQGDQSIQADLTDLIVQDQNQVWLNLPQAHLKLSQCDPQQWQFTVDQAHLQGLQAQLLRLPQARLAVLGWYLNPAPAAVVPEPNVTTLETVNVASARPSTAQTATPLSPRIILKDLDLGIARVSWQDKTDPNAEALVLHDVSLTNDQIVSFSDSLADVNNPIMVTLKGRLDPLIDRFEVRAKCLPFAAEQSAEATVTLDGLHGAGLTRVWPGLASSLDGSSLSQGHFSAQASLTTALSRRHFLDFDWTRPFALNLEAHDLRLTNGTDTVDLLGFNELHVEAPQIDLVQKHYQINRIEWTGPLARLHQTAQGLEIAGLTLKSTVPPASAETVPADPNRPAPAPLSVHQPDVTIDQILVSGLDVRYLDDTVEPPVVIPLNDFDFEWRGFSTRALTQAVPMQFNALLSAGDVPIAVGRAPSSSDPNVTVPVYEQMPLLQEVTATGRLTLGPRPQGWIKAGVNGLELRALRGLAQKSGVSIGNGVLDASLDVRIKPDGKAPTTLGLVFSDLSLSESSEAPLSKLLHLTAPLDVVLFAIKDLDGALRLKPHFVLDRQGLSRKQISEAVFGAVGALVTKAFVTSPFKPATAVGGLLGIGRQEDKQIAPITLTYEPGTLVLSEEQRYGLDEIIKQLKKDPKLSVTIRHTLGAADLKVAERLANPSLPDRKQLIHELQQRQRDLLARRSVLLDEAETAYGLDNTQTAQDYTEELIALHERLGLLERSLDNLLETLRPSTDVSQKRRTREGAIALGQARLNILEQTLAAAGIPIAGTAKRVNTVPARYGKEPQDRLGSVTFTLLQQTK